MAHGRPWISWWVSVLGMVALPIGAQTLPATGSIFGTVVDPQGAPLPGAGAQLLGGGDRQPAVTDSLGTFRFLYLSPGTYSLKLSLDGFASVDVQQVVVEVARSTPVRITMQLAPVAETITVTDTTPAIDPRRTVTGATFGAKELQQIPSARNIWATLWEVPGIVNNQVNVGGNTAIQANPVSKGKEGSTYNLEGADITLAGISPTFYNFDSFQEIQVVTGGSDVTLLNGGATFNMVVKRGNNAVHGSARYFYAPERWEADNTPPEVNLEDLATNRTNVLRDYGVEAGGPIVTDRLWLWGAWGKNQIDLQQLGQLTTEGVPATSNSTLENFDGRLDAQIVPSNSLELYYHHGDRVQLGRGASIDVAPEAAFDLSQPVPVYKVEDAQVFSSDLTGSAFYSYMDFTQTATPVGGLDTSAYLDPDLVQRGSTTFSRIHAIVHQGGASASRFFTTGTLSHELKVGFGYRSTTSDSMSMGPGNQILGNEASSFAFITRGEAVSTRRQQFDGFVSDTLTADRLTVTAGLRYDYGRARNGATTAPGNPQYPDILPTVQYPGDEGYPISAGSWEPRVGATYALGASRKTLLRASYARFSDLFLDGISLASPFPSLQYIYYTWDDVNHNHRVDLGEVDFSQIQGSSNVDPSNPGSAVAPNRIAPDLRPTTIDEGVIGVDRELFDGLIGSVRYTYRSIRGIVFSPDIGVTAGGGGYAYSGNAAGSVTDPNGFTVAFDVPYFGLTLKPPPTGVVLSNRPDYGQTYQGLSLQLVKALSDRWLFRGMFSWNHWTQSVGAQSVFDPNEGIGGPNQDGGTVTGTGSVGSAWTFSASGLYRLPFGLAASGILSGRQGFPLQYFVVVNPHDTKGNQIMVLTAPVGTYRLADVYQLDLRLQDTFAIGPVSLTPSFNVFNAANSNTVLARRVRTGVYDVQREPSRGCPNPPFCPDSRFNEIQNFQSPRIFQIAIQVSF